MTKTLLALIEKPDHVCYRYRVKAFAPALAERGWCIEAQPIERGIAFLRQLKAVAHADAVILQRRLLSWWQLTLLRRKARYLLFDIDDAVFLRDSNSSRGPHSVRRSRRFRGIVQRADAVLAGNAFLAEEASRFTSADRVHYMPTCVDPTLYGRAPEFQQKGSLRLAWIGSRSTMPSLEEARPGLAEASRKSHDLTLRVICDAVPRLEGVAVEARDWSEATEADELAQADAGISWLPEHLWSRGKCGLKVLQYMAAGLPVVANPFGVHTEMVSPGVTGFLPHSAAAWADGLVQLANDPSVRRSLGEAGRDKVKRDFSVQTWGPSFASFLPATRTI